MSCMHKRHKGYPFGSLVEFASNVMRHPIFSFSQLGIHTRNLLADPRCTLVVQQQNREQLPVHTRIDAGAGNLVWTKIPPSGNKINLRCRCWKFCLDQNTPK
ncbi:hypothetical protein L2E82_30404 [Cichorium intybus]|uniref:Uncharacterized protein n=1 Tax=Cichorium intybus TaxID=13427 RepID=A0ACB9D081_CICIN|nr:hypothetical protein L2E82_30404 [Cichorium intybus]